MKYGEENCEAFSMEEAVDIAKEISITGDIVLLSPAAASFDMFKSAYDRGDKFKAIVERKTE